MKVKESEAIDGLNKVMEEETKRREERDAIELERMSSIESKVEDAETSKVGAEAAAARALEEKGGMATLRRGDPTLAAKATG